MRGCASTPDGASARGGRGPSRAELERARSLTVDDVIAPSLSVLFCGINPGLYTAWCGYHFGRPGNRFWKVLHLAGFTPQPLHPSQQSTLLDYGYGVTNLVARASARADELTDAELVGGALELRRKVQRYEPSWLAILGVTAYRVAFQRTLATVGEQSDRIGATRLWVLPNPSGLNAHYQLPQLVEAFAELRRAAAG